MPEFLFDGWSSLGRTVTVGVLAYLCLIVMLRVSGKRTLSKMNAFELIVTVALGSTLSSILINRSVPLSQGLVALALLIGLQFLITWLSVRWKGFHEAVTSAPTMLLHDGELRRSQMIRARVTASEIQAALRESGLTSLDQAEAVVLESDGTLSVIPHRNGVPRS